MGEIKKNDDPSICPCGNKYWQCKNPLCVQEMIDAEDAAYCHHGYLAGCPICTKKQKDNENDTKNN